MAISPLTIRKASFKSKLKGFDPVEVEEYLTLVADELAKVLQDNDRLIREREELSSRLRAGAQREQALQDTLLQAQRMSDEIIGNARREAQLVVREAEHTADKIVSQGMDHIARLETKVAELRQHRRELQARCRAQLELFSRLLDEDIDDERNAATVRTLRAPRRETSAG
jgi:cell division initiation protein